MGAKPFVARAQVDYARMLVPPGLPGDHEKALALVTRAVDTARELGMQAVVEKAEALKLKAEGTAVARTKV